MAEEKVQTKKYGNHKLSKCIEPLHLDLETADVFFEVIGDNGTVERVPAHKSLLAAVSDVFKAMFYGQLKEEGDVKLTDVTAEALKEFLQFFYMIEIQPTMENIIEVMYLGNKYNVPTALDACGQFLSENLTDDLVCTGLKFALLYDQKELLKFCEIRIACNTEAVFKSRAFLECDKSVLEHILKMNLLSSSEFEMFEACMSWVRAKSNQSELTKVAIQTHLGELFYEIRFPSMKREDFVSLKPSYNHLFSCAELNDIMQTFTPTEKSPKLFNANPRQIQWKKDAVIRCDRVKSNNFVELVKMHNTHTTTISSNEPILLGGFVCAKVSVLHDNEPHDLPFDLPIQVTVAEASNQSNDGRKFPIIILSSFPASLTSTSETLISLPVPVLIRPGLFYKIRMEKSRGEHCVDCKELKTEVQLVNGLVIKFHGDKCIASTRKVTSQITGLEFNQI